MMYGVIIKSTKLIHSTLLLLRIIQRKLKRWGEVGVGDGGATVTVLDVCG
ncbi:hypothetical protein HanPSC8_Chr09g0371081 [Helianthus annuus]|nr:hypothetical protein HanPSC8_Chr09g0371081 [Helianthus annuus]